MNRIWVSELASKLSLKHHSTATAWLVRPSWKWRYTDLHLPLAQNTNSSISYFQYDTIFSTLLHLPIVLHKIWKKGLHSMLLLTASVERFIFQSISKIVSSRSYLTVLVENLKIALTKGKTIFVLLALIIMQLLQKQFIST